MSPNVRDRIRSHTVAVGRKRGVRFVAEASYSKWWGSKGASRDIEPLWRPVDLPWLDERLVAVIAAP